MRSFYILFAFLAATVMAAPINGQPSEELTKRQDDPYDYVSDDPLAERHYYMGANIVKRLMQVIIPR
ncbi:hypothetical protein N7513_003857 [Penicillium frequentans]|nr:hypothetical protein N7513_003857 [Penicillium glabrum]